MTKLSFINLLIFSLIFTNCKEYHSQKNSNSPPKNVIFLISDGAGLSQISSAYFYKDTRVHYSRFKHIGLMHTFSSDNDITDSAASATAFATGQKTYNGAIGVLEDHSSVENLVELASAKGVKSGIVSTSSITHATPACFFAHVVNRSQEEDIAFQLSLSEVDYFAGGGNKFFSSRRDGIDVTDSLRSKGFVLNTKWLLDFESIKNNPKQAFLLAEDGMPKIMDGRGTFLKDATLLGVKFLNQKNAPFFLMAEGAQIDWGGHDNDAEYLISELIDFDETIGAVLDFAEKDGETLVIVTSDHETGGFTLGGKKIKDADGNIDEDYNTIAPSFSTEGHSATLIPVFAFGPGAEEFSGVFDNTEIFHKIIKLTSWNSP